MRFFLDEGAPRQIGDELVANGFEVIYFSEAALPGMPDNVVADIAIENEAVLVAVDRDMKEIAKARGVSNKRYKELSLLAFRCREPDAVKCLQAAIPFIRLQLDLTRNMAGRKLFFEIRLNSIKINNY